MKRKIYQLILSALIVTGCYDDDKVWNALDEQQQRLDALEKWQTTANANIQALQTLLNRQDYVTAVTPVTLAGDTVGYTIAFRTQAPVTLHFGTTGPTGPQGPDGPQGETGDTGETPVISVTQADDVKSKFSYDFFQKTFFNGQALPIYYFNTCTYRDCLYLTHCLDP